DLGPLASLRQADLDPRAAQVLGERRPLELLLPDEALALGRADAAEMGAHASPVRLFQNLRPLAAAAGAALVDVLDPRRARPPARQVVGVGDQRPDLAQRRGDGPSPSDAGHE